ncbi:MAG: hypothetical protein IJW87_06580 [Clostridia bacterium]|nr:hypothetical protein [Clostridia bacterium]
MTYGELKKRIFLLLDVDPAEAAEEGSLAFLISAALAETVNAVARKAAFYLKSIFKTETLYFSADAYGVCAKLPEDAAAVKEIRKGRHTYGVVSFEKLGDRLFFFDGKEGTYTVGYYAFPHTLGRDSFDEMELEGDVRLWDAVAYGVCAELCSKVYPGDMKRYVRLATEFDERMTVPSRDIGDGVKDRLFARKRSF